MPSRQTDWRSGSALSTLIHALIIVLALLPASYTGLIIPMQQGAGGPGPAGGGGGRSAGPKMEIIQFVQTAPPPPPTPTPVLKFTPPPVVPLLPQITQLKPFETLSTLPTGSGVENGLGGAGPGSGGGVGSGTGTGKGSSVGPGIGGGGEANFAPSTSEMYLPPLPVPPNLRGRKIIAEFDVDERGKVLSMTFTGTGDRGYDRRLAELFKSYRFRPGTRPDGTPIRMKAQITIELP